MTLICCQQKININRLNKIDPTRTTSIRRAFVREMKRRFKRLLIEIKKAIVDLDVLDLEKEEIKTLIEKKQFRFRTSAEKIEGFMDWLQEMEELNILQTRRIPTLRGRGNQRWSDVYVQSAYRKGVGKAFAELKNLGITGYEKGVEEGINVAFNRPFHVDRLGILYTRTFTQLKGIDDEMDKQISGTLAEGLAKGLNPREMARNITDRVEKIGINRATTLARTEVIRAHAEAGLNEFEAAGLEGVLLQAEWLTAGGTAEDGIKDIEPPVCELCKAEAERSPMTIEEARGLIPFHPNCRCAWIPYIGEIPE